MKKAGIASITTLVAALWAVGASATPIQVAYTGFTGGSQSGSIYGVRNASVAAGQFGFNVVNDGGVYWDDRLEAFCIDVKTNLITSGTVQYDLIAAGSSSRLSSLQLSLIGGLYDNHYASLGSGQNDAAFQLALWEIVYNPGTLNLTNGTFYASTFNNSRTLAQSWLSGLVKDGSYVSSSYEFFVLESPNNYLGKDVNQSLLLARSVPVPEPGTLALLGVGLLAAGVARRRRPS